MERTSPKIIATFDLRYRLFVYLLAVLCNKEYPSFPSRQISKKKKKFVYESRSSVQLEGAELALYEEVARTPPFLRRTLALVGTRGVGRRTLKNRMIHDHPDRFGAVVPRECLTISIRMIWYPLLCLSFNPFRISIVSPNPCSPETFVLDSLMSSLMTDEWQPHDIKSFIIAGRNRLHS